MNKGNEMGNFREEITLVNAGDTVRVEAGLLKETRQITLDAVVDTGATTVVIDENIRRQLGLSIVTTKWTTFANGTRQECGVTEPVIVHWKNRLWGCPAVVVPGAKRTLLGAIPLEGMDLMVDPVNMRLTGVHGEDEVMLAL
ncbi:MAG: retroviral-like aspartic protease family protein [Treponema sp.]|jgi:clan AA aspartic protease|nr:retroviral-like aspartic protease family protein [Treponema sp.]